MQNKSISKKRKSYIAGMRLLMGISVGITCTLLLFIIGYVMYQGLPNITWELLTTKPQYLTGQIGILPDILNNTKNI